MRIDLPCCGFKNCRYSFDGNCTKPSEQEKCEYWYILHEESEEIRCRDCKHWYPDVDSGMACELTNMSQPEDGFCNWAERKEECTQ